MRDGHTYFVLMNDDTNRENLKCYREIEAKESLMELRGR